MVLAGPARVVQWLGHLAPCAVECDVHCVPLVRGSVLAAARVKRIRLRKSNYVKNNSCAHDYHGDNPGQATEGSTVSSIKCDHCWHLD